MNDRILKYINSINSALQDFDFSGKPTELYEPIRYILTMGGKRIRPLLSLLSYGLFRDDPMDIVHPSLAIEIFHNFTLMHDDIMDRAPVRRGNPTVHEKWNENAAILSGDTMLVKAYEPILKVPENKLKICIEKFNTCAVEVCEGQQWDMNFETEDNVSEDMYLNMIRLKTSVLLGFAMEFGSILANATKYDQTRLKELGISLGMGFQLKDDLLDVYGKSDKFGKQAGGDILSNKKTFLLINALNKANEDQRKELKYWIGLKEFDPKEKISAVMKIYADTKIRNVTEAKMNEYVDKGYQHLDSISVNNERKTDLRALMDYLVSREK